MGTMVTFRASNGAGDGRTALCCTKSFFTTGSVFFESLKTTLRTVKKVSEMDMMIIITGT